MCSEIQSKTQIFLCILRTKSLSFSSSLPLFFPPSISFFSASVHLLSCFSHVQLFVTLWTIACQAPLSMGFSRQECWGGLPCLPPGVLPKPGIEYWSPALAGKFFTTSTSWEAPSMPDQTLILWNLIRDWCGPGNMCFQKLLQESWGSRPCEKH